MQDIGTTLLDKDGGQHPQGNSARRGSVKEDVILLANHASEAQDSVKKSQLAWQSINYETLDNDICRTKLKHYSEQDRSRKEKVTVCLVMGVGICTGLVTVGLLKFVEFVNERKTSAVMSLWQTKPGFSWLLLVSCNGLLFVASALVPLYWMKTAAGSGIPEVKAFLNGVQQKKHFNKDTFLAKLVSVAMACSTGLPVGPEGPIIYLGGAVGHIFSMRRVLEKFGVQYTNKLRRALTTLGVSAGVSSAFSAPIGAVLFTVEEVSSGFRLEMLWVGFICSFMSYFATVLLGGIFDGTGGGFSTGGIFDTGAISQWQPQEILSYAVFGMMFGILGVIFNVINVHFVNARFRNKYIKVSDKRQLVEVFTIALLWSSVYFFLPQLVPCIAKDSAFPKTGPQADMFKDLAEGASGMWCNDPDTEFNPLATLMFSGLDDQVKYLMAPDTEGFRIFPTYILALYSLLFFIASCFISGTCMATGLFIPMIIMGAGIGRCYGRVLQVILPHYVANGFDSAAYAAVGAAGFIGGVTHISVAITVIMLEISGDLRLLLPIMLTVGVAKFIADLFVPGIYDMILEMRHVPFLEPEPNVAMERLRCHHVMNKPVIVLPEKCPVCDIVKTLLSCLHNGFPVVDSKEHCKLLGIITRGHLEEILQHLDYFSNASPDISPGTPDCPANLLANHHRATTKDTLDKEFFEQLTEEELSMDIDLHRWMNKAPQSINHMNRAVRAFELIQTFGLRHLPVVNSNNCVVGFISRHDLFHVQHHPEHYEAQTQEHHGARRMTVDHSARRLTLDTGSGTQTGIAVTLMSMPQQQPQDQAQDEEFLTSSSDSSDDEEAPTSFADRRSSFRPNERMFAFLQHEQSRRDMAEAGSFFAARRRCSQLASTNLTP